MRPCKIEPSKANPPKRKRRWFQFSLRMLLIGVTLLGLRLSSVESDDWHVLNEG
jgi:hypothetical protein